MDLSSMVPESKVTAARTFQANHPAGILSSEEFDIYIIDEGFAEDPGTDDTKSNAYRGFVQQRARAKRLLNTWAEMLPPEEAYRIVSVPGGGLRLVEWNSAAWGEVTSFANRIESIANARVSRVKKICKVADAHILMASTDEAALASAMLKEKTKIAKGLGIIFQRHMTSLVDTYNEKCDKLEHDLEDEILRISGDAEPETE